MDELCPPVRVCPCCESVLFEQRCDAVYCSTGCRVNHNRGSRAPNVTPVAINWHRCKNDSHRDVSHAVAVLEVKRSDGPRVSECLAPIVAAIYENACEVYRRHFKC